MVEVSTMQGDRTTFVSFCIKPSDLAAFKNKFNMLKAPMNEFLADRTSYTISDGSQNCALLERKDGENDYALVVNLSTPMASVIQELRAAFEVHIVDPEYHQRPLRGAPVPTRRVVALERLGAQLIREERRTRVNDFLLIDPDSDDRVR